MPLIGAAVGALLALAGMGFAYVFVSRQALVRWIEARQLLEVLPVLLLVPIVTLCHECGHLLAGLAAGMSMKAIYVKPLLLEKSERWRLRVSWRLPMGGFVYLTHPAPSRSAQTLYIVAGPLANFATALCIWPWLDDSVGTLNLLMAALFAFSLLAGVASLMPIRHAGGWASDSVRLIELWRSAPPSRVA